MFECRALKRVRETMGFRNVIVMVPFCRTPAEADRVLEAMAENGLRRGENGLQIYMMCEIPSNVILAEQFATRFDGIRALGRMRSEEHTSELQSLMRISYAV